MRQPFDGLRIGACLAWFLSAVVVRPLPAVDWPAWRCDASRSASTTQNLAAELHLQWSRQLPLPARAWPDQDKLTFDSHYQPIVVGQLLLVGSTTNDSLSAYSTRSGQMLWSYVADGPIRLSPVADSQHVFFVSDDGHLYCLNLSDGRLVWKFRGGPADRHVLGNGRLISTWPARGGPVLADGIVYFAASIWPFMGTFIHAVNAETGEAIWTNDGDGSMFIKQPHNADSFAGVAPQGSLLVAGDALLIPGGRSVPAAYDRRNGKFLYYQLAANGKNGGGSEVISAGGVFVNGGQAFDLKTGNALGSLPGQLAYDAATGLFYLYDKGQYMAVRSAGIVELPALDRKGNKITLRKLNLHKPQFSLAAPGGAALIKAGHRLYGAALDAIVAIDLPPAAPVNTAASGSAPTRQQTENYRGNEVTKATPAKLAWQAKISGLPVSLLAADDRLFAVTADARVLCFGADRLAKPPAELTDTAPKHVASDQAKELLELTGVREGYCVLWGIGDGSYLDSLLQESQFHVVAIDPDAGKVAEARQRLAARGVYGHRVSVHQGTPHAFSLPPYFASLMVCLDCEAAGVASEKKSLAPLYAALRPYGGVIALHAAGEHGNRFVQAIAQADLSQSRHRQFDSWLLLERDGALPGAANWTHEHADAANTRVSPDQLVKAPLGLLWFGGPSNAAILPRHGHGPQPQVVDGRIIIEGPNLLRAMDVYTGRLLWERNLPGFGDIYNNTAHHPGANGTGTNYISQPDGIYAILKTACLRLDPATGETISQFELPAASPKELPEWTYVNVMGDYLIAGSDRVPEGGLPSRSASTRFTERVGSQRLWVLNRHSGKVLWDVSAVNEFRHNGICVGGGRLYCVDLLSQAELDKLKRRGETPTSPSRLAAYDLATGKRLWSTDQGVFGTWLSHSALYDVLVESGRPGRDVLKDEPIGMRAFSAADGRLLWHEKHAGPAILHGEKILLAGSGCELLTGKPLLRSDPVTGEPVPWTWTRNYGCNTPQASEHLMLFRSGAAGYLDLAGDGGTGNFGGFRSSCTNNLIAAGGVLSAAEYTRTCSCSYQNQTSIGLVHMPEAEIWTQFPQQKPKSSWKRLAINLGAPGNRRDPDGNLWWNQYPGVQIKLDSSGGFFNGHSSKIVKPGASLSWVAASGCRGIQCIEVSPPIVETSTAAKYTLRLHFCDPDQDQAGTRQFDVHISGTEVLSDFDIVAASGGRNKPVVKEFKGLSVDGGLELEFVARADAQTPVMLPLLCGLELILEE